MRDIHCRYMLSFSEADRLRFSGFLVITQNFSHLTHDCDPALDYANLNFVCKITSYYV